MSIAQFRVFRDIAQARSISRAAELNQISQSAVSQTLKSLEKQLGAPLVDRRTRPLKLTPAGAVCLDASRDILRRYEEMETRLEALRGVLTGEVRVASIYSIGLYEMQQLKTEFERLHPQTRIELEYLRPEKVYEAVQGERADLGLVSYPKAVRGLQTIDWRREQMMLVCHPDHPLAGKASIQPRDLARRDFISFEQGLSIRRALDRFFREHGVHREVAYEFDNIQMIKEALRLNQGVSVLPERTVRREVAEGRLVVKPIEARGLVRPVGIILSRKRRLSHAAEEFLQFLKDHPQS